MSISTFGGSVKIGCCWKENLMVYRKWLKGSQILAKLQEADDLLAQGLTMKEVCRKLHVHQSTYEHWRSTYQGMDPEDIDQIRNLKHKNHRLSTQLLERSQAVTVISIIVYILAAFGLVYWLMR